MVIFAYHLWFTPFHGFGAGVQHPVAPIDGPLCPSYQLNRAAGYGGGYQISIH